MKLLDPRFNYIPAAETDIAATWKRFGFDARANAERRARLRRRIADATAQAHDETPALRLLARVKA